MEMSRLSGCSVEYIGKNRLDAGLSYATQNGVTLILKGAHTIVTSPSGEQYININGNNGMACGGSGDVLGGMLAAFCASIPDETMAAVLSVNIHGLSGDIAAKEKGPASLTPTDIINNIAGAMQD